MTSITVLLVAGDMILREGLRALMGQKPGITILGEAGDGHKASEAPGTKVLALSGKADRRSIGRLLRAGASGYILKDSTAEVLWEGIESLMSDKIYLGDQALSIIAKDYLATRELSGTPELTPRELEVLQLIAYGKRTKEIAVIIGVSAKTVETHRKHIMDKLGIHSIAALTKYALREGLTTLED